jgi:hypothetical protein
MHTSILARLIATGLLLVGSASAQESIDLSTAREHLKDGFALRKAGQCAEAVPHFVESFRLLPQPKVLLNLADCEERLGRFVDAEGHWVQAHHLAEALADAAMAEEAAHRLEELAPRIPRLTIALTPGAPPSSHVVRDGVELGAASLGVSLPCNGGRHTIEVRAEGYEPKVFEVTLGERETTRVDVEPGPRWQPAEPSVEPAPLPPQPAALTQDSASAAAPPPRVEPPVHDSGRIDPRVALYLGLGAGALALASFGFGAAEGLAANSDHQSALNACNGDCGMSQTALRDQTSAQNAATLANVGFVAGAVVGVTSVALLVIPLLHSTSARGVAGTRPRRRFPPLPVPLVGQSFRGMGIESQW